MEKSFLPDHEGEGPTLSTRSSPDLDSNFPAVSTEVSTDTDCEGLFLEFHPLIRRLLRHTAEKGEEKKEEEALYLRFCALVRDYSPDSGVSLHAYLTRNLIIPVLTTEARATPFVFERVEPEEKTALEMELIEDPSRNQAYEGMRNDFMKSMSQSIEHLPLRQRQIVTMRYYESRSLEEISYLLDIREETVRTLLKHGINNLRRHFKDSYT